MGLTWGLIAAYSALAGAWASRCNILILVALIGASLPFLALIGLTRGEGWDQITLDIVVTIAGLQVGYIAALFALALIEPLVRPGRTHLQARRPRHRAILATRMAYAPHTERQMNSAAGGRRRYQESSVE